MTEPDDTAAEHGLLELVFFSVAGWRIGLEARLVCSARPATAADLAAHQGEVAALLNLPAKPPSAVLPQWLGLKRPGQLCDQEILVEGPVELLRLPVSAIHPLPALLAARTRLHSLRALVLPDKASGSGFALLLDAEALLA